MATKSQQIYRKLGIASPFDANHDFVTSAVFSASVLAGLRLFMAFYTLFVSIFVLVWDAEKEDNADSCVYWKVHLVFRTDAVFLLIGISHISPI
jgi:hypothetical protein